MAPRTRSFELRESGSQDLQTRLGEIKEEFFNLRFQNATGQLDNFKQLGRAKRDIARIETILRERELEIDVTPEASAEEAVEKSSRRASRKWGKKSKETGAESKGTDAEAPADDDQKNEEETTDV